MNAVKKAKIVEKIMARIRDDLDSERFLSSDGNAQSWMFMPNGRILEVTYHEFEVIRPERESPDGPDSTPDFGLDIPFPTEPAPAWEPPFGIVLSEPSYSVKLYYSAAEKWYPKVAATLVTIYDSWHELEVIVGQMVQGNADHPVGGKKKKNKNRS